MKAKQLAITATTDIDMKTSCYAKQLEPLIKNGMIASQLVDDAVWQYQSLRVLKHELSS